MIPEIATVANANVVFEAARNSGRVNCRLGADAARGRSAAGLPPRHMVSARHSFRSQRVGRASTAAAELDLNGSFAETEVLAHARSARSKWISRRVGVAELQRVADAFSMMGLLAPSLRLEGSANLGEYLIRVDAVARPRSATTTSPA